MRHVSVLILAALLFWGAGCARIKPESGPGAALPAMEESREPSAKFYYLESRIHAGAGRIDPAIAALEKAIEKDPESALLKRDLIRFYLEKNQKDQALALAEDLVELDPENVDNLLLLARFKSDRNRKEDQDLQDLLKRILDLDPANKETYLRLGKIYMENQQYPKALDLFTRMAKEFPLYYVAQFYLGEANMMTRNLEAAKQAFLASIELEPNLVEARFRLIDIYREEHKVSGKGPTPEDRKTLLEYYKNILEIEPENLQARLERALLVYQGGDLNQAQTLFAELAREAKTDSRLVMTAVDTYISRKRGKEAVIVFSQLLKADPENDNLIFFTAMAHESAKDFQRAVDLYRRVSPEHPQYKKAVLTTAFLYRDMGKIQEAIQFLEDHHAQSPMDIDILLYLSSFYEKQEDLEKAISVLEEGLAYSPENTSLLFRLGAIQDKKGLRQECIQTMKQILRIDPEDASALNYLGYTYADMGVQLDQALDLVSRALKLKPEDGYITDSLGWVYFKKKEYGKAILYLERAAELSDYETVIADHLADAYVKAERFSDALTAYEKALARAGKEDKKTIKELEEKIKKVRARLEEEKKSTPVD
ncbi:tetratricopeptide repeat protein [Desulfospira joergensenii]|uniref:tetratricopeptide repeat protein n=1 Tax=Desulfospira joergensenii TaxID=53329 RepID=UPI0003B64D5A|nr:tetratricopeptide repeat protein [Desulfospira joergensenii]